ncbi:PQQ-dependent sugar dehydrogenase [Rhodohalobacter mucosus]|nr:PQQ-dependent sugar dehydrogenase [Rhodohalobacter mucosus]
MPEGPVPLSGDVPEATGWSADTLITGLEQPWAAAFLPGGDLLITERPGRILRVSTESMTTTAISGVPDVYSGGQGGLLDISLHPLFEENGMVYLTYASGDENVNRTTVGRGQLDDNTIHDFEEIFRVFPDKDGNQHFGSRMEWTSDSTFAVSVGDGGNRPQETTGILSREHAQLLNSHLGKILHLNQDGSVAAGNPFENDPDAFPEVWSYGHRNIQGMAIDPKTGNLWANEHGSKGGDELNLIQKGANYGWPDATYSREYWYTRISRETSLPGMEDPKVVWTPSQAPSGLMVYTGDAFPEWQGDLFSGGLVGEQVRRIILDGETIVGEEKIPIGRRVRDVKQGPDGFIYVLTAHDDGELIRITPE